MKRWTTTLFSSQFIISGSLLAWMTYAMASAEDASWLAQIPCAYGLLLAILGFAVLISAWLPEKKKTDIRKLSMAALFAALAYIAFAVPFFRIDIPVGSGSTSFHLGNTFCVLGALFLGGSWGGMAGAVGLTIADLTTPAYITSAPKTFFLKLCIGLIAGLIAHKVFHLSEDRKRKLPMPVATIISCTAGMLFNVIADPLVGYFYQLYVLGNPEKAAKTLAKFGAITTSVNALVAVVAATILYLAIRPALKRAKLLPHI